VSRIQIHDLLALYDWLAAYNALQEPNAIDEKARKQEDSGPNPKGKQFNCTSFVDTLSALTQMSMCLDRMFERFIFG
jgi:hypothetical protein